MKSNVSLFPPGTFLLRPTVHVLDQGARNCLDPGLSSAKKIVCRGEKGENPPLEPVPSSAQLPLGGSSLEVQQLWGKPGKMAPFHLGQATRIQTLTE
jgi:hypothetical protein